MIRAHKIFFTFMMILIICLPTQKVAAATRTCKALLAQIREGLYKNEQLPSVSLTAPARIPWLYQKESITPLFDHVDQMGPNDVELIYVRRHGLVVLIRGEVYLLGSDFINRRNKSSTLSATVQRLDRNKPDEYWNLAIHLQAMTTWQSIEMAILWPIGTPVSIYWSARRRAVNSIRLELPSEKISLLRLKLVSDQKIQIGADAFDGATVYDTRTFYGGVNRGPAIGIAALLGVLLAPLVVP